MSLTSWFSDLQSNLEWCRHVLLEYSSYKTQNMEQSNERKANHAYETIYTNLKSKNLKHVKLNGLITNSNAHVRIWMLEETLSGMVANLNAPNRLFILNDKSVKLFDVSANMNDRITKLNDKFHSADLFSLIWMTLLLNWMKKVRNWPQKPIFYKSDNEWV